MSCKTTTYTLGELVELSQGLAINVKTKHLLCSDGLPLLRIADLISRTYSQFVNPNLAPNKCLAKKGDLIYTRTGQVGLVFRDQAGVIHNNSFKIIPNEQLINKDYLYWFLSQNKIKKFANDIASGSVQKDLNHSAFKTISIELPEMHVQKNAVKVLDAIEKKIINNTQTNQTLEAMAQAIFKSWFVDFDPVHHKMHHKAQTAINDVQNANTSAYPLPQEILNLFPDNLVESELGLIPEGWEVGTLSDVTSYHSKKISLSELTVENYISTENMLANKQGVCSAAKLATTKNVPAYESGNVLISNIRPYFKKIWLAEGIGGRSNDVLGFESVTQKTAPYLFNLLYQDSFFDYMMTTSKGSKMPRGDKTAIMNWKLVIPTLDLREKFSSTVSHFYQIISTHRKQNIELANLRDTLLPKLLSGEIDLAEPLRGVTEIEERQAEEQVA